MIIQYFYFLTLDCKLRSQYQKPFKLKLLAEFVFKTLDTDFIVTYKFNLRLNSIWDEHTSTGDTAKYQPTLDMD